MNPSSRIRLLVVEDEPQILRSQVRLLADFEDIEVCGEARDGTEALRLLEETRPDVVLLDLGLPDRSGIEVTREIVTRRPGTEVLVWTIFEDESQVLEAIRAGASGYLLKGTPVGRLVDAIRDVKAGGTIIQPQLARRLLRRFRPERSEARAHVEEESRSLSPREREILAFIARGLSNSEIAQILKVSRATVRTHLEHIYAKLDVTNRTEAVTEGIRKGLIDV